MKDRFIFIHISFSFIYLTEKITRRKLFSFLSKIKIKNKKQRAMLLCVYIRQHSRVQVQTRFHEMWSPSFTKAMDPTPPPNQNQWISGLAGPISLYETLILHWPTSIFFLKKKFQRRENSKEHIYLWTEINRGQSMLSKSHNWYMGLIVLLHFNL